MKLTGETRQFEVFETETINGATYAPGVYKSFNTRDAKPGKPEFFIEGSGWAFVANDLNTALRMWVDAGAPQPVTHISTLG